jgi:hypothetical protein
MFGQGGLQKIGGKGRCQAAGRIVPDDVVADEKPAEPLIQSGNPGGVGKICNAQDSRSRFIRTV